MSRLPIAVHPCPARRSRHLRLRNPRLCTGRELMIRSRPGSALDEGPPCPAASPTGSSVPAWRVAVLPQLVPFHQAHPDSSVGYHDGCRVRRQHHPGGRVGLARKKHRTREVAEVRRGTFAFVPAASHLVLRVQNVIRFSNGATEPVRHAGAVLHGSSTPERPLEPRPDPRTLSLHGLSRRALSVQICVFSVFRVPALSDLIPTHKGFSRPPWLLTGGAVSGTSSDARDFSHLMNGIPTTAPTSR